MRVRKSWTSEEDDLLSHHAKINMKTGNDKLWNQVALNLPGRTNKDCRKRWMKLGTHLKKGLWTNEEDQRLESAINQVGCNWVRVASILKTRHADQCSKRWQYHLDPSIDRSGWDIDEDNLLLQFYESHGRTWNSIKKIAFPKRSATSIKNRCNLLLRRKRSLTATQMKPTLIASCSQPKLAWKDSQDIINSWDCPEETDSRENSQKSCSPSATQSYVGTPNGSPQDLFVAHSLCVDGSGTIRSHVGSSYNNGERGCWQKSSSLFNRDGVEERGLSGFDEPRLIHSALLTQMRNQANLPFYFWMDNYFPISDPLWNGILTLKQNIHPHQAEDSSDFLQTHQASVPQYITSLHNGHPEYPKAETIWHELPGRAKMFPTI